MPLSRSLLFVPAHVKKMLDKALGLSLDAAILDLEDAVPPAQKTAARDGAREYVGQRPGQAFVRINPLASRASFTIACGAEDLAAVVTRGAARRRLPKVETVDDLLAVDEAIVKAERHAGLTEGQIELYSIVETARGVLEAPAIARARMRRPAPTLLRRGRLHPGHRCRVEPRGAGVVHGALADRPRVARGRAPGADRQRVRRSERPPTALPPARERPSSSAFAASW
jgi:hypothetical protein